MKINFEITGLYIMIFGATTALGMALLFLDSGWKYVPLNPIFILPAIVSLIGMALIIIPKLVGEVK